MKIALVAPGRKPIPVPDSGSIENLIWNYKLHLEKRGHQVDIYNTMWIHETVYALNTIDYDFIHLHFDVFATFCNKYLEKKFCLTSHCGGFTHFQPGKFDYYAAFNYLYSESLEAPGNIVLSEQIKGLYKQSNYNGFLKVLRNPIEIEKFKTVDTGNGKAVYLANITKRKRQAEWAHLLKNKVKIDFIGPWDKNEAPNFEENETSKYLGVWKREMVYDHLTDYSCLVLLSSSEADPLVVKEALAAGVSLVVNTSSSAHLTQEEFITILSDDESNPDVVAAAISSTIAKNTALRSQIKEYAKSRFSYDVIVPEYLQIIEEFKSRP